MCKQYVTYIVHWSCHWRPSAFSLFDDRISKIPKPSLFGPVHLSAIFSSAIAYICLAQFRSTSTLPNSLNSEPALRGFPKKMPELTDGSGTRDTQTYSST